MTAVVTFPKLYSVYRDRDRPLNPRLGSVSIWATGDLEAAEREDRLGPYLVHQVEHALLAYVREPQSPEEADETHQP
jgi:hypothetical protein